MKDEAFIRAHKVIASGSPASVVHTDDRTISTDGKRALSTPRVDVAARDGPPWWNVAKVDSIIDRLGVTDDVLADVSSVGPERKGPCKRCFGGGREPCLDCDDNRMRKHVCDCPFCEKTEEECNECDEDGEVTCRSCDGDGLVSVPVPSSERYDRIGTKTFEARLLRPIVEILLPMAKSAHIAQDGKAQCLLIRGDDWRFALAEVRT